MAQVKVRSTLEEDFEKIGLPLNIDSMLRLSGNLMESEEEPYDDSWLDEKKDEVTEPADGEQVDESLDPIDGKFVTNELFDRIEALPFDTMEDDDCEELLSKLAEKEIPEDDSAIMERAENVVAMLKEAVAKRQRRFKAGSTARKVTFQCPQGMRAVKTGGGRPQCRPAHIAAGGMGKLNKESRKKKKWSRGGKGKMSMKKSGRVEKRRMGMRHEDQMEMSPLAMELMSITESVNTTETSSVRDEVVDRMVSIVSFLDEEFADVAVSEIYNEAIEGLVESYEHGRLDEDVLSDADFIREINPVIELIVKSFEKIEDGGLGNE